MADLRFVATAVSLVAWWAISAGNQFRSGAWTCRIRRHVPLGLIPLWTFFAPNPGRADSRLIWREEYHGAWHGWRELHFGFAPLGSRWLANPQLILNKAVADLVNSLLLVSQGQDDRSVIFSSAYLTLLNIVLSQPRPSGSESVQFAIVRTSICSSERRTEVAFVSEVHTTSNSLAHV